MLPFLLVCKPGKRALLGRKRKGLKAAVFTGIQCTRPRKQETHIGANALGAPLYTGVLQHVFVVFCESPCMASCHTNLKLTARIRRSAGQDSCLKVTTQQTRTRHGCCWETVYNVASCGLVGHPHLTAKIYFVALLPTSTK